MKNHQGGNLVDAKRAHRLLTDLAVPRGEKVHLAVEVGREGFVQRGDFRGRSEEERDRLGFGL